MPKTTTAQEIITMLFPPIPNEVVLAYILPQLTVKDLAFLSQVSTIFYSTIKFTPLSLRLEKDPYTFFLKRHQQEEFDKLKLQSTIVKQKEQHAQLENKSELFFATKGTQPAQVTSEQAIKVVFLDTPTSISISTRLCRAVAEAKSPSIVGTLFVTRIDNGISYQCWDTVGQQGIARKVTLRNAAIVVITASTVDELSAVVTQTKLAAPNAVIVFAPSILEQEDELHFIKQYCVTNNVMLFPIFKKDTTSQEILDAISTQDGLKQLFRTDLISLLRGAYSLYNENQIKQTAIMPGKK